MTRHDTKTFLNLKISDKLEVGFDYQIRGEGSKRLRNSFNICYTIENITDNSKSNLNKTVEIEHKVKAFLLAKTFVNKFLKKYILPRQTTKVFYYKVRIQAERGGLVESYKSFLVPWLRGEAEAEADSTQGIYRCFFQLNSGKTTQMILKEFCISAESANSADIFMNHLVPEEDDLLEIEVEEVRLKMCLSFYGKKINSPKDIIKTFVEMVEPVEEK